MIPPIFEYIKLYVSFPTRSIKVVWLLNELKVPLWLPPHNNQTRPFTPTIQAFFLKLERGDHMNKNLNPHPFLKVPSLVYKLHNEDKERVLFESGAMLLFLLEHFDKEKKLCNTENVANVGDRYKWLFWTSSSFEMESQIAIKYFKTLLAKKGLNLTTKDQLVMTEQEKADFDDKAKTVRQSLLPYLESQIASRDPSFKFIFGNSLDVADMAIGFCLKGIDLCSVLNGEDYPKTFEYYNHLCATESYRTTLKQLFTLFTSPEYQ